MKNTEFIRILHNSIQMLLYYVHFDSVTVWVPLCYLILHITPHNGEKIRCND